MIYLQSWSFAKLLTFLPQQSIYFPDSSKLSPICLSAIASFSFNDCDYECDFENNKFIIYIEL
jgi:hypothetical protein